MTGGVLTSAALLFLAVQWLDPTKPQQQTNGPQNIAMKDSPAASALESDSLSLNDLNGLTERRRLQDDAPRKTAVPETAALVAGKSSLSAAQEAGAKRSITAGAITANAPSIAMKKSRSADAASAKQLAKSSSERPAKVESLEMKSRRAGSVSSKNHAGLVFGSNLKNAHVGEAVKALERSGGRVTVITLTVVDRRAGLDDLQILLARHHIPKVPKPSRKTQSFWHRDGKSRDGKNSQRDLKKPTLLAKKSTAKKSIAKQSVAGRVPSAPAARSASPSEKGELVAVYVEATSEQLASVLGELQRRKQFVGLNLGQVIAVAQLDVAPATTPALIPRSRVADPKSEQGRRSRLDKKDSDRKSPTLRTAKRSDGKKESPRMTLQQRKSDARFAGLSRQLRLMLPADTLQAGIRKGGPAGVLAENRQTDKDASDGKQKQKHLLRAKEKVTTRNSKPAEENRAIIPALHRGSGPRRSVQVLFVLVTRHK